VLSHIIKPRTKQSQDGSTETPEDPSFSMLKTIEK